MLLEFPSHREEGTHIKMSWKSGCLLLLAAALLLASCATPTPHKHRSARFPPSPKTATPQERQAQHILKTIESRNRALADQLREIPCFNDGIDQQDLKALEAVAQMTRNLKFPPGFPYGRFVSPRLFALACLTADGLFHDQKRYSPSLEALIHSLKSGTFKEEELYRILHWEKGARVGQDNFDRLTSDYIIATWDRLPELLEGDFPTITSRLNRPDILDWYERTHFSYATTSQGYGCGGVDISDSSQVCDPAYIFGSRRGNCAAYTRFTVYCLRKAGYRAYSVKVFSLWPAYFCFNCAVRNYHYLTAYQDRGKWWIMDNGRGRGPQGILGPVASLKELPYQVLAIEP